MDKVSGFSHSTWNYELKLQVKLCMYGFLCLYMYVYNNIENYLLSFGVILISASGDDTNVTPSKGRAPSGKESIVYQSSHPTTPQSTAPSPGTASLNSIHEEYPPDHSPTWSRTPNSPVSVNCFWI